MKFIVAFDVEGPIANPGFDFTWICLEYTSRQFYERIKLFDEYDDLRWVRERSRNEDKHSTGTTPLISLLAAACEGFTDLHLTRLAMQKLRLSKGAGELLKWLISERGIIPYFITSSYPAVSLLLGREFIIPSSHIYCAGNQPGKEQLAIFDSHRDFEIELKERSPVEIWNKNQVEAKEFLNKYLENCIELRDTYIQKQKADKTNILLEAQQEIFREIQHQKLRSSLTSLILNQKGVMGGHNKKKVLQELSPDPKFAVYLGDGIVDADCLEYAKYGIAINCTNSFALQNCKLNIATSNEALLIPVLEQILQGKFDVKKESGDELLIFSQSDIKARFEEMKSINGHFREAMRQHF